MRTLLSLSPKNKLKGLLLSSVLLLLFLFANSSSASDFDCEKSHCGLPGDGPYPNLVLGTVKRVATAEEAESVFRWAHSKGYWKTLPNDPAAFAKAIQMMSIETAGPEGPEVVTLLMGREHYDAIEIAAGDFVRYTPHESEQTQRKFDKPADAAYWHLFGCIAVLCRADDLTCPAHYRPGVYRKKDGIQLGLHTGAPLDGGIRIDPDTFWPVTPSTPLQKFLEQK